MFWSAFIIHRQKNLDVHWQNPPRCSPRPGCLTVFLMPDAGSGMAFWFMVEVVILTEKKTRTKQEERLYKEAEMAGTGGAVG